MTYAFTFLSGLFLMMGIDTFLDGFPVEHSSSQIVASLLFGGWAIILKNGGRA